MTDAPERIWACSSRSSKLGTTVLLGHAHHDVDGWAEYVRADKVQALVEAMREGVSLIKGDKIGSEWKRGCADFVRTADAALAAFTDAKEGQE